jgi:LysM repeat protein
MIRVLTGTLLLVALLFSGCFPEPSSPVDEQKEPHYLRGRSLISSQDYKGAIEEFERAIEVNPRSAAAHFELAWLYEDKIKDFAAAIYHYQRHLQLRPNSEYGNSAREHIRACKTDLARSEIATPLTQGLQKDLDRLNAENILLKRQVEALNGQVASLQNTLKNQRSVQLIQPTPLSGAGSTPDNNTAARRSEVPAPREVDPTPARPVAAPRKHTVKSGDTLNSIARQYGVKITALTAANPGIDPKKMRPGQTLNIP